MACSGGKLRHGGPCGVGQAGMVLGWAAWWGTGAAAGRVVRGRAQPGGEWGAVPRAGGSEQGEAGGCCARAQGANEAGDSPSWPVWPPGWRLGAAGLPPAPSAGQWRGESRVCGGKGGGQAGWRPCQQHPPTTMALQAPLCWLWGNGFAGLRHSCSFVPWAAGEAPQSPRARDVGCSGEGTAWHQAPPWPQLCWEQEEIA